MSSGRLFEIREFAPNGELRRIIRLARDPEPINDAIETRYRAVLDSMLDEQAERMPEFAAETRSQRQIVAETPFHKTLPAISMMGIDRSGNLWVTGLHSWWSRASEDPWDVFDRTGRWLTTVLVPQHLRVLEIGDQYVIAAVRDELDVPFIHVYELQKS